MYILNKNKIKCVYPSKINYYKLNVDIDNNTCTYFCLKMLTSMLHYVCIFVLVDYSCLDISFARDQSSQYFYILF